jgi:hypothetical protein
VAEALFRCAPGRLALACLTERGSGRFFEAALLRVRFFIELIPPAGASIVGGIPAVKIPVSFNFDHRWSERPKILSVDAVAEQSGGIDLVLKIHFFRQWFAVSHR